MISVWHKAVMIVARDSPPKVVLVGDSGTGKTSIAFRYVKSTAAVKPTINVNAFHCHERVGGRECHFELWDTAGQESYKCLVPIYARGAVLALIVFDRSSRDSFDNLAVWSEFLKSDVAIDNILVVGNKSDVPPTVSTADAQNWCSQAGAEYIETSAKTGANIDALFQTAAKKVIAATDNRRKRPQVSGSIVANGAQKLCAC
jgi:small GTP-binding protein